MADTQKERLDRIEFKLDQMAEVMVSLARVEEKLQASEEVRTNALSRMNRFSEKLDEIEKVWAMTLGKKVPLDEHGMLIKNPINTWRVELASVSPQAFEAFQEIDEVKKAAMAKGAQLDEPHRLWLQSVKSFAPVLMKEIRQDCSRQ